jgi:hypothetical protein
MKPMPHARELPTLCFSELSHPVFPTTSMVAVGLPNTGKYEENASTVGDCRGWFDKYFGSTVEREGFDFRHF